MKLLLADDHALFRDALLQYIERADATAKVTLAKDFPGALKALNDKPDQDLVLLDLKMPGMNGLEGFKTLRDAYPNVRVGLMSGTAEKQHVREAMALGAVGYFPKTLSGKALIKAIYQVIAGEKYMPVESLTGELLPSYFNGGGKDPVPVSAPEKREIARFNFTPREKDVLAFLLKGRSNKEIANALDLQVVTIKLHVRGICRKLGASNRTQAALIAKEAGLYGELVSADNG